MFRLSSLPAKVDGGDLRMTPEEARRRVAGARVARLATLREDGTPHLVPFCFALDGDRLVSAVDHKPKRTPHLRRLRNLAHDDRAAVLVDAYDERWDRLWWVRLEGTARVLPEGSEAGHARSLLTAKYPQYREGPPLGAVLSFEIRRWSSWEAARPVRG